MLARLTRQLTYLHRTREQAAFLDSLPTLKFTSDEELIANTRTIYDKRVTPLPRRSSWRSARPSRT
jgi:hypothetical protein